MFIMDAKKKPVPIKEQSSWPWHPILLQLRDECDAAPEFIRKTVISKMIERCLRLGAKLAVHYGFPSHLFMILAATQLQREGAEDMEVAAIPLGGPPDEPAAGGSDGTSDPNVN